MNIDNAKANILIVDDEPSNLFAIREILSDLNQNLILAKSGEEALRYALEYNFAVILLDIRMPGLDGFETASLIRQRQSLKQTPIIFLTGVYEDVTSMFRGYEIGAADYILKPVVPAILKSKISVFVDLHQKTAELKRQKDSLHREVKVSEERFYDLVQGLDAIVWEMDPAKGGFSFVSRHAEIICGYPVEQWLNDPEFLLKIIHPEDQEKAGLCYKQARESSGELVVEYRAITIDKKEKWLRDHIHIKKDNTGKPKMRGIIVDISHLKQTEEYLAHLAHYDPLTQLPNRALLFDRLEQTLSYCRRNPGVGAAVLFVDLDQFKQVNDTLGHKYGDILLKIVAQRLKECVRETDTVARLGGDEFVVLLTEIKDDDTAIKISQKILDAMAKPFYFEDREWHISCSIGTSVYPEDGDQPEILLRNADIAMYNAKQHGKNNYQFYTMQMHLHTNKQMSLINQLHHALEKEEFVLYYQPVIDIRKNKIVAAEALLRWKLKDGTILNPSDFIPLLEETKMIIPVGEWALMQACAQNKAWQEAGLPPIRIAVNLSVTQLQHDNLINALSQTLQKTNLDPEWVELEVTESMMTRNIDQLVETLNVLDDMKIHLSIDDFGVGYSSLSYLKRFPIRRLKIDQSFIRDIPNDSDSAAIILAMINMAHSLQLTVVAEGVETKEQLDFLKEVGCDEIQGHIYDCPLPCQDIIHLLKTKTKNSNIIRIA
jgi:diguanylate cyclase (GGDEF)-like protein/PAS domain S-box-containing protein